MNLIFDLFVKSKVCKYECICIFPCFVCAHTDSVSLGLRLFQSVHPVHHRHQIESGMSADVLQTIFTASLKRTAVFI